MDFETIYTSDEALSSKVNATELNESLSIVELEERLEMEAAETDRCRCIIVPF